MGLRVGVVMVMVGFHAAHGHKVLVDLRGGDAEVGRALVLVGRDLYIYIGHIYI